MITYHGTNKLVLVKRTISANRFGLVTCQAEYSCPNSYVQNWATQLTQGNAMPGMPQFIIDMDVNIDIGQNGFTRFTLSGYSGSGVGVITNQTLF